MPEHLERKVFEADPDTYRNRTLFDTDPTNPGLAFGPYRIAQLVPGSQIVLDRNPTWWGEPPAFDRIVVKAIENTTALEANLLSGEVDMIEGSVGLSLDQALAFERRHGDRFQVLYKPGLVYEHLDVMLDNPVLADPRVRQALLYGLDRAAISERLFAGRQPVADTPVHPLDWVHTDDVRHYPYDPAKAALLLDEAGWTSGAGGLRRNAAGEPLRLELMTTAGNRTRELIQQVAQSQWRQLGIETVIRNEPPRVFFGETTTKRRFTGLALFAWISSPENVPRTTLHSEEIPSEANGWSGQNFTGYRNPRMDAAAGCDRGRARPGEAGGVVARAAADLRRGAAGAAAVLPRRRPYLAEMAAGRGAHRPHGAGHVVGRALARRRRLAATLGGGRVRA